MTANASELLLLRERFHSPATLQARRTLPEVIAQEALVDALRDALSTPTLTMAAPPSSLQGGFSRVLIHVRVRSGTVEVPEDLVVRILPDVEARDREVAFQATLARQGFPTIEIIATGDGNDEIGPFSVMPFVAGRPFVDLESPREMVGAFRRVPAQLARTMATLHAVDPAEVMRAFDAHATRPDVDALLEQVRSAAELMDDAELTFSARSLAETRPTGAIVVCHGDLHPVNMIVRDDGTVVLLDWELACLAPPELDLARTALVLELIPGIRINALRPVLQIFGRRSARQFLSAYYTRSPYDRDRLAWCRAFAALRIVTLVLGLEPGSPVARNWAPLGRSLRRIALGLDDRA